MSHYAEMNIFPKELFSHSVVYENAAALRNKEGEYYRECGIHDGQYDIDAIFFEGNQNTKVFAYLGVPKGVSSQKNPAVILLHGGLGRAELSWVKRWNERGFVAIAPDLYGDGPEEDKNNLYGTGMRRHPYGGVYPWDENAFLKDYKKAGMYQNVVTAIYAHNLLRSLPCVDCSKIGVTGISWGGVTTTIFAGVDDRLSFAAPIYGCGHISESFTAFRYSICRPESTSKWDPAHFASKAKMPVLYINGNSDDFFSLNMTSETYLDTPCAQMAVYDNLVHSQEAGENVLQAYTFAEKITQGRKQLPRIESAHAEKNKFIVKSENAGIVSGIFYYHTSEQLQYEKGSELVWHTVTEYEEKDGKIMFFCPKEAVYGYAAFKIGQDDYISTPYTRLVPPCGERF